VETSLRASGFRVERVDLAAGVADVFGVMDDGLVEWHVAASDGRRMVLQMAYFDRGRNPVLMDIGRVLDLDDVLGGKVCALASRAAVRDWPDGRGLR
jgi:hypothetical protein